MTGILPPRSERAGDIGGRVERVVRDVVIPREQAAPHHSHGPSDTLVMELRELARAAGVLTPHILADGDLSNNRSRFDSALIPNPKSALVCDILLH